MYNLSDLLNPTVYRDIMVVRLMREKIKFDESFIEAYRLICQDVNYKLTPQEEESFHNYNAGPSDVLVLKRILGVFEMYRDNRYVTDLNSNFWCNRKLLQSHLISIYDNQDDIDDVIALAEKLYWENENATAV